MIIAVDIDNVLNDLAEKTINLYNEISGNNIQMSDITTYDFNECVPPEDADAIVELFKKQELWDSLMPLTDSQAGLKTLVNMGHEIYLATATHPENFMWKVEWIKKYYPFINTDNIIRIINKGLLKCDVMIDDCLDNLISNMCNRICLDYPWNRQADKEFAYDIVRVYNWKDIVNIINKLERKEKEWEK
jgi:5'(3')-deoxyribonucleotidase